MSIIFLNYKNFFNYSVIFTLLSIVFDVLDGYISRIMKNTDNKFGRELDSLADMVSFGVVPTLTTYLLLKKLNINFYIEWISISIAIFSALRLAKFNTYNNKKGLKTPINTLFFYSIFIIINTKTSFFIKKIIINNPIIIIILLFFSCYFLISKISMLSLKFQGLSWNKNKIRYIFIFSSLFLFMILQVFSLPCIIINYIIISILFKNKKNCI